MRVNPQLPSFDNNASAGFRRLRRGNKVMARRAPAAAGSKQRPAPRLGRTMFGTLRSLARDLFDPYRPELHYMRGPGPKWRAKHARVPAQAPLAVPGLGEAAV